MTERSITFFVRRSLLVGFAVGLLIVGVGCPSNSDSDTTGTAKSSNKIRAVCTIGMITDIVATVGGERVEVVGLMGPGVDPHLYKPGESDIGKLRSADVIFYNGLGLEGKMADLFVKMARSKPTVAVTEDIDLKLLREPPELDGHYDPHVWFDVKLWIAAVRRVQRALAEHDTAHAEEYRQRADAYVAELEKLDAEVAGKLGAIPEQQRVLVTAHDAFGYFGRAYKVEVHALQGVSTETDFGPADVQRVADLLVARGVKAIFVESSVNPKAIEAVRENCRSRGHAVAVGGELFSDALGDAGTPAGRYVGMVRHNVDTIAKALK